MAVRHGDRELLIPVVEQQGSTPQVLSATRPPVGDLVLLAEGYPVVARRDQGTRVSARETAVPRK